MPDVQFESVTESLLRLPDVIKSIPDILRNPAANPLQATVLLGIAIMLVLILVLTVLLAFMRPSAEEEALLAGGEPVEETEPVSEEEAAALERAEKTERRMSALTVTSIIILVAFVVVLVTGVTTADREVCVSCHPSTVHAAAKGEDPHKSTRCVDCHEGGGKLARMSVNLLTRMEHVVFARVNNEAATEYGKPVASDGCYSCHRETVDNLYYNAELKLKVEHSHPVEAGAQCVDCHAISSGTVSAKTVGMSPCLRCHDGTQASAECSVCHDGDPSQAIKPEIGPGEMAARQVPNPQCDGCHKDQSTCFACHGIEMPHSQGFMAYAHAREAAIDIWYGDGKKCEKCHYVGHNDCVRMGCHSFRIAGGHPNPAWAKMHQATPWNAIAPQTACSCHNWNPFDHDGMIYCQICHAVKPKGAKTK